MLDEALFDSNVVFLSRNLAKLTIIFTFQLTIFDKIMMARAQCYGDILAVFNLN